MGMRVIVAGAGGRMGRMLVRAVHESESSTLVGAVERRQSIVLGLDAGDLAGIGDLGVKITADAETLPEADVYIDFTAPEATLDHAAFAAQRRLRMVIGTTGFSDQQLERLRQTLSPVPALMAANYSVGVNLALGLIREAATVLGSDYDAEIIEAHHRHKVDAPSGTALAMGKAVAAGRKANLNDTAVFTRAGNTGERRVGDIGFAVIRGGDIVGEHTAMFAGLGERLEIRHVATDRMTFARGAMRAAAWLMDKPAGYYGMRDVLGLG